MKAIGRKGFTLVEIMVVIVIIGLLVAMAVPTFQKVQQQARANTFLSELRIYRYGVETFALQTGEYPTDTAPGTLDPELAEYLKASDFAEDTPVGGKWDIARDLDGVTCAVGVVGVSRAELIEQVDDRLDDGNITTGLLRTLGGESNYYWIVREVE